MARKYKNVAVYRWHPHTFGKAVEEDPYRHVSIIQDVVPTRTGLDLVKSSVVVWMTAVNDTLVKRTPEVYSKPWTEDDHWRDYMPGGSKYVES